MQLNYVGKLFLIGIPLAIFSFTIIVLACAFGYTFLGILGFGPVLIAMWVTHPDRRWMQDPQSQSNSDNQSRGENQ